MKAFSMTDIGMTRTMNQDYIFSSENAVGNFPNLFLVADGMGGHQAGDYASRVCVETIVDSIKNSYLRTEIGILEEAIKNANRRIYTDALSNSALKGMGTTLVAAVITREDTLYVANIGDSRLYIVNRQEIKQITEDHSYVEELIRKGEIRRSEARNHPKKNVITRAIGTSSRVIVDYFEVPLRHGDKILLCSDGLSNMIEDRELQYIIESYSDETETAVKELVKRANENGGKDNISTVLIKF